MLQTYNGMMKVLDKAVKVLCTALGGAMALIVIMQVFTRHCPWVPTPSWTEELARYIMIYMAYVGASHGIRLWDNVNVDMILNAMPEGVRWLVELLIKLFVFVFLIVVTVLSVQT